MSSTEERTTLLSDSSGSTESSDVSRLSIPELSPPSSRPSLSPLNSLSSSSSRPRSIRSIASYGATERVTSPSPEPEGRPSRKVSTARKDFGNRCLCVLVSLLLAVCVYASFVEDFMGDVETAISCGTCIGLLAPLQALAHVGDDAFVDLFVGFCTKLGVNPVPFNPITSRRS